jgi:glycosyltransferase involved in cell wall biosynthesis
MINEISIVIPTLNEENYLPLLLNSIIAQDFKGKMQIIIVDGNSDDNTLQVAKKYKLKFSELKIIFSKKRGVGYQRNRGADKAKYKYILFLDADIILPRQFLTRFIKKINVNESFIDIANIWLAEQDLLQRFVFLLLSPLFIPIVVMDNITPGLLILTTKENHIKIHGFREDLKISEDIDYGWRSVAAGAKYHMHLFTYALHSARRIQKVGIVNFYYEYLTGYIAIKKHGIEAAKKIMNYTYSDF